MKWVQKKFDELTRKELYTILQRRVTVFVVEQACPYPEIDGIDKECHHIWLEDEGEILAYCRIVPPLTENDYYAIGRVLVVKEQRGRGYAHQIMNHAIDLMKREWEVDSIWLHGQEYLREFYRSFGFEEISDVYLEDDIPHVDMLMKIAR